MGYYFINTDSRSLGGKSPHDKWFQYGCAFTGGPIQYGQELGRLSVGDTLVMYASRIGVVGIGSVRQEWDGREQTRQTVYVGPYEDREYRVPVAWFLDLRDAPLTAQRLRALIGWTPLRALHPVRRDAGRLQALIDGLVARRT